jgi:hypothetical protein
MKGLLLSFPDHHMSHLVAIPKSETNRGPTLLQLRRQRHLVPTVIQVQTQVRPVALEMDGAANLAAPAPEADGATSLPAPALGARRRHLPLLLRLLHLVPTAIQAQAQARPVALEADGAANLAAPAPEADVATSLPAPALGARRRHLPLLLRLLHLVPTAIQAQAQARPVALEADGAANLAAPAPEADGATSLPAPALWSLAHYRLRLLLLITILLGLVLVSILGMLVLH